MEKLPRKSKSDQDPRAFDARVLREAMDRAMKRSDTVKTLLDARIKKVIHAHLDKSTK